MMPLSGKPFTVEDGIRKYNEQMEFYCSAMWKRVREFKTFEDFEKAFKQFTDTCFQKCKESLETAKTGHDVFRGIGIETEFYRALGWTDEKIEELQRSYD